MIRESKMGCNLFHCEINHTLLIIMILIYMFVSRLITGDNCFFDIVITKNETQSGQFGDKLENVTSPCIIRFVFWVQSQSLCYKLQRVSPKNSDSSATWTEVVCYVFIGTPSRYIWFVSSTDLPSSQFIIQYDQGLFISSFVLTLIPTKLSRTTNMLH